MYKNHPGKFFALEIHSGFLELSKETRQSYVDEIDKQSTINPNDEEHEEHSTWTGDVNSHSAAHLNPVFDELFACLKTILHEYCKDTGLNPDMLNFYVARSWGTKSKASQSISPHSHSYSNITVVYYPSVPKDSSPLIIEQDDKMYPNEIIDNLYSYESYENGLLSKTHLSCARQIRIQPKDDLYVIFPAKQPHHTRTGENESPRYSIAIDVIVTLKETKNIEYALPPIKQWALV